MKGTPTYLNKRRKHHARRLVTAEFIDPDSNLRPHNHLTITFTGTPTARLDRLLRNHRRYYTYMNDAEKTQIGAQKTLAAQLGVLVRRRRFLGRFDPESWSCQGDPPHLQARNAAFGGKHGTGPEGSIPPPGSAQSQAVAENGSPQHGPPAATIALLDYRPAVSTPRRRPLCPR